MRIVYHLNIINYVIRIVKENKMIVHELNKSNILLFAMANYNTARCLSLQEFKDDMRLFKKLNTQLSRTEDINVKAAVNMVITLNNQFGGATPRIILFYLDETNYSKAASVLSFLNILPDSDSSLELDHKYYKRIENITR